MTNAKEACIDRRRDILAALILLPFIVWEAYVMRFGGLIQFAQSSSHFLLYFALFFVLFAAWNVVQLEYFPQSVMFGRKTQVWYTVAVNLWSAGLILMWLRPKLSPPIFIVNFIILDVICFQMVRDLIDRASRRARDTK